MEEDNLQEALTLVNKAVSQDKDGHEKEAISLYEKSLKYMKKSVEAEKDVGRKSLLDQKIIEYSKRIEQLKEKLSKKETENGVSKFGVGSLSSQRFSSDKDLNKRTSYTQPIFNPFSVSSTNLNTISSQPTRFSLPPLQAPSQQSFQTNLTELSDSQCETYLTIIPDNVSRTEAFRIGNELCRKGKEFDDSKCYSEALKYYKKGLSFFLRAMKDELNSDIKLKIGDKMRPFLNRAEFLSNMVGTLTEYEIHPVQVPTSFCNFCKQPLGITETYKVFQEKKYHIKCLDKSVAIVREEVKKFLTSKGTLKLSATIPKRTYKPGEEIELEVHIKNESPKKVLCVVVYILRTDTLIQIFNTSHGIEKKAKVNETKECRKEFRNSQFPLENDSTDLNISFIIPSNLETTEKDNGNFAREYDLVVKCKLPVPHGDLKTMFPISIIK